MIRTLYARASLLGGVLAVRPRVAAPARSASPRAGRRRHGAALVLGAVWLGVMLWHLRPPYPSDQLHYLAAGAAFPDAPDTELAHQVLRFGVTAPTRLAIAVFGYSQAAYYAVPVAASLLLLGATYALGALLFARTVGVAAAAVVITSTPIFLDVSDLLPDVLAAGLFAAAVAIAVAVRRGLVAPRPSVLLTIGLLLGWSYLTREFIVFVWPLVLALLWGPLGASGRPRRAGLLWLVAPVAGCAAVEAVLCWYAYGDPLARLWAVAGHGRAPSPPEIAATYRDKPRTEYLRRLWDTLAGYPPQGPYPEGWWTRGLLVLTAAAGLVRPRRFGMLLGWCLLLWVPLTLLGGVLDPQAPKLRLQLVRYWFPIFPAFVLGGLGAVWAVAVSAGRRRTAAGAALVLAVGGGCTMTAVTGWWGDRATRAGGAVQMDRFRSWMKEQDGRFRTVWSDSRTLAVLKVFQQGPYGGRAWDARLLRLGPGGVGPRRGDLVVLFDNERGRVCGACRAAARRLLGPAAAPRPQWHPVFATRDRVLRAYAVGHNGSRNWSRPPP